MSGITSRPYAGVSDLPSLIEFAQRVGASSNRPSYYHPGDVVWQLSAFDATDDVRLWFEGAHVVGCGIFEPPLTFQFEVDPGSEAREALAAGIVAWAEDRHATATPTGVPIAYGHLRGALSVPVSSDDHTRVRVLASRGFTRTRAAGIRYEQSLQQQPPAPALPSGAIARHALPTDIEERVDLHRDAWSVWGTSTFSLEQYTRLRAAPLYDPDLDVVVDLDGRLVSYCIGWLDDINEVGYFEPVGTRPAYAGRGFGRAAITEGLRRMRARGMSIARVGTASINAPAQALYQSSGFVERGQETFYSKDVSHGGG